MKEIIKKIVIAVVAVIVVVGVAAFFLKGDKPDKVDGSTTTSSAEAVTGENGKTTLQSGDNVNVDATTDANGNGTTANSQQGGATVNPQIPGVSQNQQNQGQQNSQPSSSADVSNPQTPGVSQNQQSTSSAQIPGLPQTPDAPQRNYKIDYYQNVFRSGKFMMKVSDPDLGPVTMAMSGNKMYVEASMEGISLKMIYDGDKPDEADPSKGTWYIVIDKIKKYSPMPADMLGDMNVEELTKDFAKGDSNTVYTTSVETVNGEQLECESCVDANGNTTKYYFRGNQLVRSDSISPSGSVSTTEFQEINADVDESLFAIPSGYAKWDITWLFNMLGQ